jgi:hypothetical protein
VDPGGVFFCAAFFYLWLTIGGFAGEGALINDAACDDGGDWSAAKFAAVEWSVARFAGGIGCAERPGVIEREKCEIGWLACGESALHAENARGAGRE